MRTLGFPLLDCFTRKSSICKSHWHPHPQGYKNHFIHIIFMLLYNEFICTSKIAKGDMIELCTPTNCRYLLPSLYPFSYSPHPAMKSRVLYSFLTFYQQKYKQLRRACSSNAVEIRALATQPGKTIELASFWRKNRKSTSRGPFNATC